METVLNLLPLTDGERRAFQTAAPGAEHLFYPVRNTRRSAEGVPAEAYAKATVILGCPPADVLGAAKHLKWLHAWSAGVDGYLRPGVLPEGVALTSSVGAYGQAVSEHMLAMLLAMLKRLPQYRDVQNRRGSEDLGEIRSLRGATVLLLGTGDIGSAFARQCRALGAARILGVRRNSAKPADGVDEMYAIAELDSLLPLADVVAMVLPRSAETDGLMDRRRLLMMQADAVLRNAGRGTAVDCAALAEVLSAGHLWAAGLDVTDPEPLPPDHPLWAVPNVLLTPHVAGGTNLEATVRNIAAIALDNLGRYLAGEPLRNRFR